jgi:RNA polymerase sigma-70 factor (ECF subfamily)
VFAYLRRSGVAEEEAKDLTQEFFLRLMSRNVFAAADRSKGKFRTFLLTALKFFVANERDRARAAKRGGGKEILSLDREPAEGEAVLEPATLDSPAVAYEEAWARTVFTRAEALVGDEYQSVGKAVLFAGLKEFLERGPESGGYQAIAARLGMTPNAVGVAVHRMRHRFGELIRSEVARTLCNPTTPEVQEEVRYLMELLARDRA